MSAISITARSAGLAILIVLTCGSAAQAAIVSWDSGTKKFRYAAVNGERNEVFMEMTSPRRLVIRDSGANIVGTERCVRPEPDNWHYVSCRVLPRQIRVSLGDQSDTADLHLRPQLRSLVVFGGTGDDEVTITGARQTSLYGQAGIDVLDDGDARGYLSGGDGLDTLVGSGGPDALVGGAGPDLYFGGAGKDVIDARDGAQDGWIDCGSHVDMAKLDLFDAALPSGCESVGPVIQGATGS